MNEIGLLLLAIYIASYRLVILISYFLSEISSSFFFLSSTVTLWDISFGQLLHYILIEIFQKFMLKDDL